MTEFLGGEGGGAYRPPGSGATATVAVASNWAEEMEDEPGYEAPRQQQVCSGSYLLCATMSSTVL